MKSDTSVTFYKTEFNAFLVNLFRNLHDIYTLKRCHFVLQYVPLWLQILDHLYNAVLQAHVHYKLRFFCFVMMYIVGVSLYGASPTACSQIVS